MNTSVLWILCPEHSDTFDSSFSRLLTTTGLFNGTTVAESGHQKSKSKDDFQISESQNESQNEIPIFKLKSQSQNWIFEDVKSLFEKPNSHFRIFTLYFGYGSTITS